MGIGNTTSSTAIAEIILGASGLAGLGTGIDADQLQAKRAVVADIKARYAASVVPEDPLERAAHLIRSVGGFEHAALAGAAVSAALNGVFVILDGLIVTSAIAPFVSANRDLGSWFIAGHQGSEAAHGELLGFLGLEPILRLEMRLGEGSGALLAAGLLHDAHALVTEMATFEEAQVDQP
jgi:nicotinate-nucleotide--dimethylbenzimidazole phosphoribosyltransferase